MSEHHIVFLSATAELPGTENAGGISHHEATHSTYLTSDVLEMLYYYFSLSRFNSSISKKLQ